MKLGPNSKVESGPLFLVHECKIGAGYRVLLRLVRSLAVNRRVASSNLAREPFFLPLYEKLDDCTIWVQLGANPNFCSEISHAMPTRSTTRFRNGTSLFERAVNVRDAFVRMVAPETDQVFRRALLPEPCSADRL